MSDVTFDLLIVGAGPAGSAAALGALAADPSVRVGLVDRAAFPRDKVCGDGLTPTAVSILDELGVPDVLDGWAPVSRVTALGPGGGQLSAGLSSPAYVVPRQVLDARLVEAAVGRGAELIHERITDVVAQGDRMMVNGRWSARCLVGADGANSVVRTRVGLPRHPTRHTGVALRGYAPAPVGTGRMDIRFVPDRLWPAYGWAFTAGDGSANVGVGTFDATTRPVRRELTALLHRAFPHLDREPDGLAGHLLPLSSSRPALGRGRVLLVGDAAGLVDPLTGEGIHTALLSGMLAGRAGVVHRTDAADTYRHAMRRRLGPRLRHMRVAAWVQHRPESLDAVIAAAAGDPAVAAAVAALALGDDDPPAWARVAAAALGQRLRDRLPSGRHHQMQGAEPPMTNTTETTHDG